MKRDRSISAFLCLLLALPLNAQPVSGAKKHEIDRLLRTLYQRGQFNGSIAVAVGGKTIYRQAFGFADFPSRRKFTPKTKSNLGSVSKQFTAMAIMMLAESGKLSYDDPVSEYLPELAGPLNGVTLRQLLNHTSGIPDVGDLGIDHPHLSNGEVLRRLSKPDFMVARPGQRYRYSNANYVLLASVVEKVSGQRLADFCAQRIFQPLGMHHTFISQGPPADLRTTAKAYDQFGMAADPDDLLTGSSGMYSTVDDLLKWARALDTGWLVRQSTLAQAFIPGSVQEGTSSYGFGWNISDRDGRKVVWHQGSTGGFRALIERGLSDQVTVVILTNKGNTRRLEISDAIARILDGRAYVLPKRSIAEAMYRTIHKKGMEAAVQLYQQERAAHDPQYDLAEPELNSLGYQLLYGDRKPSHAIEIFKLNTVAYPASSNAFDSLGEAYQVSGNKDLAIQSYQRAVQLDPTNLHAVDMLKKLR